GRGVHPGRARRMSREVVLAARPQGEPRESDFELRESDERDPADGEVLVRNVFVSVDPYMRSRMTGIRTYVGPYEVGAPIDGGAAVQIAKLKGLRVIGSAGAQEKVEWLRALGAEAFDYKKTAAKEALADGIDVYFDNVGGDQLEAALTALRPFGRVIACGAISRYNDERPEPGPRNLGFIVSKRLRVQGFIVTDHGKRFGDFLREVGPWVADGKL